MENEIKFDKEKVRAMVIQLLMTSIKDSERLTTK